MFQTTSIAAIAAIFALASGAVSAKLPAPSEEAKAKAEEAKAKAAHADKVAAYQLCNAIDKVAQRYLKESKGKTGKPAALPPCQDPGPFQMASSAPAAPAATPAPAAKK